MYRLTKRLLVFAWLLLSIVGCDRSASVYPEIAHDTLETDREEFVQALADAERAAASIEPPQPVIALPTPVGWRRSQPRALPPEDHGFSVAYEHKSGLAVTLYHYTRGLTSIPDDMNSKLVQDEMLYAKEGIEQAVQLGYWQAAKQVESKTVRLGDSQQHTLWSQYHLSVAGGTVASDIYVWAHKNRLFKIRGTSRSEDVVTNQAVLGPLLTAFGTSDAQPTREEK